MSTAALAPQHTDTSHQTIRIIAGGRYANQKRPLHRHGAPTVASTTLAPKPRLFQGMQGTSYHLSTGECALVVGAGIVFTLATLAVLVL